MNDTSFMEVYKKKILPKLVLVVFTMVKFTRITEHIQIKQKLLSPRNLLIMPVKLNLVIWL